MGIYTGRTSPTYYTASRSSNSCPKPYWDYVPCAHELLHIWPCKIKLHLQGVKKNKGIPNLDTTNLQYEGSCLPTGAAPKAMPPFLFCWPTTSEADVGGMAVEVEPSCLYSITCCCCVTDGSSGTAWQNDVLHGSADEATACHWICPLGKRGTHWHSLMLDECLWRPDSRCEYSKAYAFL